MSKIDEPTARRIANKNIRIVAGLKPTDPLLDGDVLRNKGILSDDQVEEMETRIINDVGRQTPPYELRLDDFDSIDQTSTVGDVVEVTKTAETASAPPKHKTRK